MGPGGYSGKRIQFDNPSDMENSAWFVQQEDGTIYVAVCDDKPVDSYNQTFECGMTLTRDDAAALLNWLRRVLASSGETG
jgi:hypothetical protein